MVHLIIDLHYSTEMVIASLESIIAFDSQCKSWLCALFWYLNFTCFLLPSFSVLGEFSALHSLDFWGFSELLKMLFVRIPFIIKHIVIFKLIFLPVSRWPCFS